MEWNLNRARQLVLWHWQEYRKFLHNKIAKLEIQNRDMRQSGVSYSERMKISNTIAAVEKEIVRSTQKLVTIPKMQLVLPDFVLEGEELMAHKWGMDKYIKWTYQHLI